MICAHCNESFTQWKGMSFNMGYKCPACGKVSYIQPIQQRDPVATFSILGFVAAISILLFVAGQSQNEVFIKYLPSAMLSVFLVLMVLMGFRARHRVYTVASLPPQELRKRRWFVVSSLVYLAAISLHLSAHWFGLAEDIAWSIFIFVAIAFIVMSFVTRSSNTNHDTP